MANNKLAWEEKFALGVDEIDLQHQFFLGLIKRISGELARDANPKYPLALLSELNAYARFHFISEENMMLQADYPNLDAHRRHHWQLLDQLTTKEWKLRSELGSEEEAGNVVAFLVQWFLAHTSTEDKQFATFLGACGTGHLGQ